MTISWLFADESTEAVQGVMARVAEAGAMVPSLWRLEVANVLRGAIRRGRCDEAFADASLARLRRMPIAIDDETDLHAWGRTRDIAHVEDLTVYDAAYLELAMRLGVGVASNDAALIAAARRNGVEVITTDSRR